MSIYIVLALLCVTSAASAYLGWLSGIHSFRNHSYRKGFLAGRKDAMNSIYAKTVERIYGER